jgi:hypothetical protein
MDKFLNVATQPYDALFHTIRSGDILLCAGDSVFSTMIQKATQSIWSHVAFLVRLDAIQKILVLESVESIGVRAVTLSSYVKNYNGTGKPYPGRMLIARHSNVLPENILNLSQHAADLLGYPYDTEEILHIAARISLSNVGMPLNTRDRFATRSFICSEYAYECFRSIGVDIPYDPLGFIAPADFARCPQVAPINFIHTEYTPSINKIIMQTQSEPA